MAHVDTALMDALADLALEAGAAIMQHFGKAQATIKADGSPVTLADAQAEAIILPGLARLFPGIPVVAEEAVAAGNIPDTADEFFLVDPLDGTKEFIAGNTDFTVNIGLVSSGSPVAGVIFAPALRRLWIGSQTCEVCEADPGSHIAASRNRHTIEVRPLPEDGLVVVASRSHLNPETQDFIAHLPVAGYRSAGSSLKFCLIAEGEADFYPRFGPTMEWDTCAGHAILLAAGGDVRQPDGGPFVYGKRDAGFLNGGFMAMSDTKLLQRLRSG
jgi:3'(2'), 5'-bisphosphate nucleotidase